MLKRFIKNVVKNYLEGRAYKTFMENAHCLEKFVSLNGRLV